MLKFALAISTLFGTLMQAQNPDWKVLSQLKTGERVKVSRKQSASITGSFQAWTPEQLTIDSATTSRSDVVKVERYKKGWGRGRKALLGAGIGAGAGFGIGAALGEDCSKAGFGPCFGRGISGAAVSGVGAIIGAIIGAVLPHHGTEVIYAAR